MKHVGPFCINANKLQSLFNFSNAIRKTRCNLGDVDIGIGSAFGGGFGVGSDGFGVGSNGFGVGSNGFGCFGLGVDGVVGSGGVCLGDVGSNGFGFGVDGVVGSGGVTY
jgi:hypothetical protein